MKKTRRKPTAKATDEHRGRREEIGCRKARVRESRERRTMARKIAAWEAGLLARRNSGVAARVVPLGMR